MRLLKHNERNDCRNAQIEVLKTKYNAIIRENYGIIVACYNNGNNLFIQAWTSKSAHAFANYYFKTEEARDSYLSRLFSRAFERQEYKEKQKATRKESTHASAAKLIKKELSDKFPGIKFSVTSDCFSGGDSVNINYTDGPTSEEVDDIVKKYQYGSFNGMEDIYEYTNRRADIPQVKYVMAQRSISSATESLIKADLIKIYGNFDANTWFENERCWGSALVHRQFSKLSIPASSC